MNIELKQLETLKSLPSKFSSNMEQQEYFSIVLHNVSMIVIQNNPDLINTIYQRLDEWILDKKISIKLYLKWKIVLNEFKDNPKVLIEKSERMQQLRSISPFSFMENRKLLRKEIFDIVFNIPVELEKPKNKRININNNFFKYA